MDAELCHYTLTEAAALLRRRATSSVELTQGYATAHVLPSHTGHRSARSSKLACPGMFMQAPPADAIDPYGPFSPALAPFLRFTGPFNCSGNSTLSVPNGFSTDGVPHGMQFVGRRLDEVSLCQVGHAYEQAMEWHTRRPPLS